MGFDMLRHVSTKVAIRSSSPFKYFAGPWQCLARASGVSDDGSGTQGQLKMTSSHEHGEGFNSSVGPFA